ncbi:MAG: iron-only hydrogenase system regulator [Negativicutes bacterium]|nr:iron-only hydrogenase system regulator [Negativicutes bacterium]
MDQRIGVVAIVVEEFSRAQEVNQILHDFGSLIVGRMGIPYREKDIFVISLILDGTNEDISALTGKLGNVKNVTVKAALTKK